CSGTRPSSWWTSATSSTSRSRLSPATRASSPTSRPWRRACASAPGSWVSPSATPTRRRSTRSCSCAEPRSLRRYNRGETLGTCGPEHSVAPEGEGMPDRDPRTATTLTEVLARRAALTPEVQYFHVYGETVTYGRLWAQSERYAGGLAAAGVHA